MVVLVPKGAQQCGVSLAAGATTLDSSRSCHLACYQKLPRGLSLLIQARLEELELAAEHAEQAALSLQQQLDVANAAREQAEATVARVQQQLERLELRLLQKEQLGDQPAGDVVGSMGRSAPGLSQPPTPNGVVSAAGGVGEEEAQDAAGEVAHLREQLAAANRRVAVAAATQQARVAALEKQNHDLAWQVAMLTRGGHHQPLGIGSPPGAVSVPMPHHEAAPGQVTFAGVVAASLRYRRRLVYSYLLILHCLVYFALTHRSACSMPNQAGDVVAELNTSAL